MTDLDEGRGDGHLSLAQAIQAAQEWWSEAGVDLAYSDTPTRWLTPPAATDEDAAAKPAAREKTKAPAKPAPERLGGPQDRWPTDLAAFADWWLTEPTLAPVSGRRRVAPAGPGNAPLMVLVIEPEEDDRERLLAGPAGRLFDAILSRLGLTRAGIYLASALPSPMPLPDWPVLAERGLGEVIARHVTLAAPQRLLIFGRDGISALLGHDPSDSLPSSLRFNHDSREIPVLWLPALDTLLARPARKGAVWARLLDWVDPSTWRELGRNGDETGNDAP